MMNIILIAYIMKSIKIFIKKKKEVMLEIQYYQIYNKTK